MIFKGYKGYYINTVDLLNYIRTAQYHYEKYDELNDLLNTINSQDLLILDDLGAERTTDWAQERLYSLINQLYVNNRSLIVTSHVNQQELSEKIGEHTVSRLCEMCFHDMNLFPDQDYRRVYLKNKRLGQ